MRRLCLSLLLVLLLVLPVRSPAVTVLTLDVTQAAAMIKEFEQQIRMYREMIEQTKQQFQQIKNQMEQIRHAATTVQHGATNLLTLDLNNMADLLALYEQLNRKLQVMDGLSFQSAQAWQQAQGLYPQMQGALSGQAQRDLKRKWAAAERSTARVALETQAIAEQNQRYDQEWQEALQRAVQAQGALQIEQAQAQMLGLQGSQLEQIKTQLATHARHTSERTMREASETELEVAAAERATEAYNLSGFTPAGRLPTMPRTGKE